MPLQRKVRIALCNPGLAPEQLASKLAGWLANHVHERWTTLPRVNVFLFLISAVMVILGSLLIVLASRCGVDPAAWIRSTSAR